MEYTTLMVDKCTHELIRQYCFLHRIEIKAFIHELANERLKDFKIKLEEIRRVR